MIFVDANVFIYAVGRPHELQEPARAFLRESRDGGEPLCVSAEILQELLHYYLSRGRRGTLDVAIALVAEHVSEVWALEPEDVEFARELARDYPGIQARDLCHLASCLRRGVRQIKTYDRNFDAIARELPEEG